MFQFSAINKSTWIWQAFSQELVFAILQFSSQHKDLKIHSWHYIRDSAVNMDQCLPHEFCCLVVAIQMFARCWHHEVMCRIVSEGQPKCLQLFMSNQFHHIIQYFVILNDNCKALSLLSPQEGVWVHWILKCYTVWKRFLLCLLVSLVHMLLFQEFKDNETFPWTQNFASNWMIGWCLGIHSELFTNYKPEW